MTKKTIVFVVRAYNDLDIQASLIDAFARDPAWHVVVLANYSDDNPMVADLSDIYGYLTAKGVDFKHLLEDFGRWPLRVIAKLYRKTAVFRKRTTGWPETIARANAYILLRILRILARRDKTWLDSLHIGLRPRVLVTDEAICVGGRSALLDHAVDPLRESGCRIYAIRTGHYVYLQPDPSGVGKSPYNYIPNRCDQMFLPNQADIDHSIGHTFPEEHFFITGNLRMNPGWIRQLNATALQAPYYPRQQMMAQLPEKTGKYRVVLMLSKLTYGVGREAMDTAIAWLAAQQNIQLVIKPHTRGMTFALNDPDHAANITMADTIPSALLIDWADAILFTGSSIAFHAMIEDKDLVFMRFCQSLPTIFDDRQVCFEPGTPAAFFDCMTRLAAGSLVRTALDRTRVTRFLETEVWAGQDKDSIVSQVKALTSADTGQNSE